MTHSWNWFFSHYLVSWHWQASTFFTEIVDTLAVLAVKERWTVYISEVGSYPHQSPHVPPLEEASVMRCHVAMLTRKDKNINFLYIFTRFCFHILNSVETISYEPICCPHDAMHYSIGLLEKNLCSFSNYICSVFCLCCNPKQKYSLHVEFCRLM